MCVFSFWKLEILNIYYSLTGGMPNLLNIEYDGVRAASGANDFVPKEEY